MRPVTRCRTQGPAGRSGLVRWRARRPSGCPGLLSEYHRRHPGVTLELRTGNPLVLGSAILAGELDAALVAEPVADVPFGKAFAFDEELVIVAPAKSSADRKEGQSAAEPSSCSSTDARIESDWKTGMRAVARCRSARLRLASYHAILGCIVAGMGISLIPKSVLTTFPDRRRLSVHRLDQQRTVRRRF